ncbi:MAG: PD-(D/E)XK nuclease domain-containing protein [Oscillospiraceae bacterium]|nr:PD-(D/E)XK nuclease domain-containing protein [Oscillospiraceae bacterium]
MSYTSYYDGKENAYHMLMLGMCVTLGAMYKITSNIKAGYGRSDIRMESLSSARPHIVIEFKQGENIDELKREALNQILEQKYYSGLEGNVTCVGVAHSNKRCAIGWEMRSI